MGQEGEALGVEIGAGLDAEPGHLLGGLRPDAVEPLDRQSGDEGLALARRDDAQAVGLVLVGGELGEELVVGHAGRGGQPGLGADAGADFLGDAGGEPIPADPR